MGSTGARFSGEVIQDLVDDILRDCGDDGRIDFHRGGTFYFR